MSGTVNFNGGATFNAGSRIDWTGGTLNLGASSTLLVDGGVFNRTITTGFIFSDNTTTRIRNGGSFITPSYFDLGTATLDMNNGFLTVGTTGGTISDWGGSGATTTATLTNNAVATYNSGLRMGVLGSGGTTNATISGGARLVSNGSLSTGGEAASNVTLNVTGGRVESDGTIHPRTRHNDDRFGSGCDGRAEHHARFERRDHHHHRDRSQLAAQSPGHAYRRSRGDEQPWRFRRGAKSSRWARQSSVSSPAPMPPSSSVARDSRLDVGSSLTIGGSGTGALEIHPGGFVPVTDGVSVGSFRDSRPHGGQPGDKHRSVDHEQRPDPRQRRQPDPLRHRQRRDAEPARREHHPRRDAAGQFADDCRQLDGRFAHAATNGRPEFRRCAASPISTTSR